MTFKNISLLVPYTSDNGTRELNWNWINERYKLLMPDIEICIGECNEFPYSRAQAINNAAKKASRDIFIISDADIFFNVEDMRKAIEMLDIYKFIVPYSKFIKLNEELSVYTLSKQPNISIFDITLSQKNSSIFYDSNEVKKYQVIGGICIIKKQDFYACGGFDERFRGWGGEDDAFISIVKYLYNNFGRPSDMTVYHLFHKSQPKIKEYHNTNVNLLKEEYFKKDHLEKTLNYLKSQIL